MYLKYYILMKRILIYLLALILTLVGTLANVEALRVIDFSHFSALLTDGKVTLSTFFKAPDFTFLTAFRG